jgi:hypothetical protein
MEALISYDRLWEVLVILVSALFCSMVLTYQNNIKLRSYEFMMSEMHKTFFAALKNSDEVYTEVRNLIDCLSPPAAGEMSKDDFEGLFKKTLSPDTEQPLPQTAEDCQIPEFERDWHPLQ